MCSGINEMNTRDIENNTGINGKNFQPVFYYIS
jgi:hypothetical protein